MNTSGFWENENAKVQTLFRARCLHSSFEFSTNFHECFITRWKQGKETCTFFHEINFGNVFLFHSVFIIVFSKNICDSVKLSSVIFYFGAAAVKYQLSRLSYCSEGCCPINSSVYITVNNIVNVSLTMSVSLNPWP